MTSVFVMLTVRPNTLVAVERQSVRCWRASSAFVVGGERAVIDKIIESRKWLIS